MEKKNESLFVRLKAGVMGLFYAAYVYIDSDNANSLHLLNEKGIKYKIKDGYKMEDDQEHLSMLIVYIPRKKASSFEECMEIHKRNSILLGWGCTEQCKKMIEDMHLCAE